MKRFRVDIGLLHLPGSPRLLRHQTLYYNGQPSRLFVVESVSPGLRSWNYDPRLIDD